MRPVVGISCYVERARWTVWDEPAALLPMTYVNAVDDAGGRPVIVPPTTNGIEELLNAIDGVVFAGGADIDPDAYGAERHPETTETRPERDRFEWRLAEEALARGVPFLGICRGMQLLNVVRGGDLDQHLPQADDDRTHKRAPGVFARHEIEIASESLLCSIVGERTLVASHHHQAPQAIGRGLRRVAWGPDGVTEGIEDPDARLTLGVLWHPEQAQDRGLFEALVERAADYRKERR
jgi:gamma-glutamyl-gamma-aminobutyrate hydrolase PuuD